MAKWIRPLRPLALGLAVTTALVGLVLSDAPARFLVLDHPFDRVDAALVLAGDPDYERTATGVRLMLAGRARLLILTGGEPGPGDSARSLEAWAVKHGAPAERIRKENVSRGTRESLVAIRPILEQEGVRTIALVTSPYHERRAVLAALRVFGPGVRVFGCPATPSWWSPRGFWRARATAEPVLYEHLKLAYYALRGWLLPAHLNYFWRS